MACPLGRARLTSSVRAKKKQPVVTPTEFHESTRCLVGLPITKPWRGYGSALFLELGRLSAERIEKRRELFGAASVAIEWSWRVERQRSVAFGSWSSERLMNTGIAGLKGRRVEEIVLVGRLPEISVRLSGGLWLNSFMTAEGKPEWGVRLLDGSWLFYEAGRIVREKPEEPDRVAGGN
jgi:hypothetical protein